MTSTNAQRFRVFLITDYTELLQTPAYAAAAAKHTPETLADAMIAGLANGSADKEGAAVKRACKALGVKHTYKALREYLSA